MSGSGWATLLITTLGAVAVASIVTTYGAQASERRRARADAREALRRIDDYHPWFREF